ncbi:MAG: hypothetical protein ACI4IJ_02035 [Acutalibacteraceae bacterium]
MGEWACPTAHNCIIAENSRCVKGGCAVSHSYCPSHEGREFKCAVCRVGWAVGCRSSHEGRGLK